MQVFIQKNELYNQKGFLEWVEIAKRHSYFELVIS